MGGLGGPSGAVARARVRSARRLRRRGVTAVPAVGAVFGVLAVGAVFGVFAVCAVGAVLAVTVVTEDPFWTALGLGVVVVVLGVAAGVDASTSTAGETTADPGASKTPCAVATVAPRPTAPRAPVTIHALRAFMILLLRVVVRAASRLRLDPSLPTGRETARSRR